MGQIAGDDDRAGQGKASLYRVFRQFAAGSRFIGWLRSILTTLSSRCSSVDFRQVFRRIGFQLLEEDAVGGDLAHGLAVGRAGDAEADGQRCAVARQADDAHIVAEILAAKLRADAHLLGHLVDFRFHLEIAEGMGGFASRESAGCRDIWWRPV